MEKNILKKIENFLKGYKFQKYRKGEIIIRAEDEPQGVFYLEEGFVKKYIISRKGDELTLNIFKPVSFFPIGWTLNKGKNYYFYEAMTSVSVWRVPRDKVIEFIKNEPDILFELLKRVHRDGLLTRMTYLMAGNAYTRLAAEIHTYIIRFGRKENGSVIVNVTEKDLASITGMTRETVSRGIKILREKGLVEFSRNKLNVKDIKKLEEELLF